MSEEEIKFRWLRLLYEIQNNRSKSNGKIKCFASSIEKRKVIKSGNLYYLSDVSDLEENTTKSDKKRKTKIFVRGRRPKMFTAEQIEKIKQLKKQGKSNVQIAKICHCSEKTIRNYLKENKIPDKL